MDYCPEYSTSWKYWNGNEWQEDSEAIVRCSDCDVFPNKDECSKLFDIQKNDIDA